MRNVVISVALLMMSSATVRAQEQVDVPERALHEMSLLVGEWEVEATTNGKQAKGTYSAKWASGKHCLILANSVKNREGLTLCASGIGGWSPNRKQYVETWYTSDGGTRTFLYSFGQREGLWIGKLKEVDKDGEKGTGKVYLHVSDKEFRGGSVSTTGEQETHVKYICRRK